MRLEDDMKAKTKTVEETRGKQVYLLTTHTDATDEPDGITVFWDYGTADEFFRMEEEHHDNSDDWKPNTGYSFGPEIDKFGLAFGLRRWTDRDGKYLELRLSSKLPM